MGFRAFFREEAPDFPLLETLVNFESSTVTEEAILELAE